MIFVIYFSWIKKIPQPLLLPHVDEWVQLYLRQVSSLALVPRTAFYSEKTLDYFLGVKAAGEVSHSSAR
jgi:hypothetical protein